MTINRSHDSPERALDVRRRASEQADHAEAEQHTPHPLVTLGGQVGNAAIARMLAQREEDKEDEVSAKHDVAMREEDKEDEVSAKHDVAMREEDKEDEISAKHDVAMREGEDDKEQVQAKPEVGLEGGALSADLSGRINSRRGSGSSLDDSTRTTMEGAFGTSFKDVRVHTDAESDALNRSISAKAFTTGSDIFFRQDTSPGDHSLLAHELTHVVQQRSSKGGSGMMTVGPAGDAHEQHADAMSAAVTSGAAATAQREADEAQAQRMLAHRESTEEEEDVAS